MNLSFTFFLYAIFLVSLFLTYAVLYVVAYKLLKLDKLINEPNLAIVLLLMAVVLCPLLFSPVFDAASYFILSWYAF